MPDHGAAWLDERADEVAPDEQEADTTPNPWERSIDLRTILTYEPEGRAWFIEERIEAARGHLLSAIGGSSKTRLLYYLGIGAVTGALPWGWQINRTGRAILVLTEDTYRDAEDFYWVCRGLGLSAEQQDSVVERLTIFPLAGFDVRLLDTADGRRLIRTGYYDQLQELILALGDVVFVGLDPALGLSGGDELDQGHQRALGKAVDDLAVNTGAAVVLTAHATKASLGQDELTSHTSRGAGAITDVVRGEFAMRTMTATEAQRAGISDIEERKRHVQLVATKGNHLPPAAYVPVWLHRGPHGNLAPAEVDMGAGSAGPSQRDRRALDILVRMQEHQTPRVSEWRAECVSQGVIAGTTEDARKKAMNRCIGRLRDAGLIQRGMGRGIWVSTEGADDADD